MPHREALLDRLLAEYREPGGSQRFSYSLEAPTEVAVRRAQTRTTLCPIVASADVGPDLLMAWRRPTVVVLYTNHEINPGDLGLAQGPQDANVLVWAPGDQSVFRDDAFVAEL